MIVLYFGIYRAASRLQRRSQQKQRRLSFLTRMHGAVGSAKPQSAGDSAAVYEQGKYMVYAFLR